ncbi:hypothetical protein BTA51_05100 [Hahella sp. CCB-MM4]|nr:hypothetical protein BTA51_05100 [Hahella sp. CCB-MM4]
MEFRADQTSDSSAWSKPEETGIKGTRYPNQHDNPEAWRYQQRLDFVSLLEAKPEQPQGKRNVTQGDSSARIIRESKERPPESGSGGTISAVQRQKTIEKREHSVLVDHPGSGNVDGEEINREPFKNRHLDDEYRMSKEPLSVTTVQALINEQSQHYVVTSNATTASTISSTLDSTIKNESVGWQGLEKMFEAQVDKLLINARQTSWDPTETVRLQLKEHFLPGTTLSLQQCSPGCWRLMANCRQAEIRDMLQKAIPGLQSRFKDKQLGELNIVEVVLDSEPGDELW